MTPKEAAATLGCSPATLRKRMAEYGGYRVGRVLRFDRATIEASRKQPDFLHAPNTTIAELARGIEALAALAKSQGLEIEALKREVQGLKNRLAS
jgi:hypothetical protein